MRHQVENLLDLAMKNTLPQGATFKNKMTAMESEIQSLEEEIKKLEDEKKTAQLGAQSGEYIHANIKTVMEYLDQTPPEVQKNILRALIENIVVFEDKIVMNMYIQPKALPGALVQAAPNDKNLTPTICQDKVLTPDQRTSVDPTGSVSTWGQDWGRWLKKVRTCLMAS